MPALRCSMPANAPSLELAARAPGAPGQQVRVERRPPAEPAASTSWSRRPAGRRGRSAPSRRSRRSSPRSRPTRTSQASRGGTGLPAVLAPTPLARRVDDRGHHRGPRDLYLCRSSRSCRDRHDRRPGGRRSRPWTAPPRFPTPTSAPRSRAGGRADRHCCSPAMPTTSRCSSSSRRPALRRPLAVEVGRGVSTLDNTTGVANLSMFADDVLAEIYPNLTMDPDDAQLSAGGRCRARRWCAGTTSSCARAAPRCRAPLPARSPSRPVACAAASTTTRKPSTDWSRRRRSTSSSPRSTTSSTTPASRAVQQAVVAHCTKMADVARNRIGLGSVTASETASARRHPRPRRRRAQRPFRARRARRGRGRGRRAAQPAGLFPVADLQDRTQPRRAAPAPTPTPQLNQLVGGNVLVVNQKRRLGVIVVKGDADQRPADQRPAHRQQGRARRQGDRRRLYRPAQQRRHAQRAAPADHRAVPADGARRRDRAEHRRQGPRRSRSTCIRPRRTSPTASSASTSPCGRCARSTTSTPRSWSRTERVEQTMGQIYTAFASEVKVNEETIEGLQSIQYAVQRNRQNVGAVGTDERIAVYFGLKVVTGSISVASVSATLDGLLKSGEKFSISATLKHGEDSRTVTLDDCYAEIEVLRHGRGEPRHHRLRLQRDPGSRRRIAAVADVDPSGWWCASATAVFAFEADCGAGDRNLRCRRRAGAAAPDELGREVGPCPLRRLGSGLRRGPAAPALRRARGGPGAARCAAVADLLAARPARPAPAVRRAAPGARHARALPRARRAAGGDRREPSTCGRGALAGPAAYRRRPGERERHRGDPDHRHSRPGADPFGIPGNAALSHGGSGLCAGGGSRPGRSAIVSLRLTARRAAAGGTHGARIRGSPGPRGFPSARRIATPPARGHAALCPAPCRPGNHRARRPAADQCHHGDRRAAPSAGRLAKGRQGGAPDRS